MSLSKAKCKLINSLHMKKFRNEHQLFVAEGRKLVSELLPHFVCRLLARTDEPFANEGNCRISETIVVEDANELKAASSLMTPPTAIALFEIPQRELKIEQLTAKLTLALDDVQDPGNLGTIIRTANWFGIENIICSPGCADVFNPKVVQATMGALAHVNIIYTELLPIIKHYEEKNVPVYGTLLDGKNIYETPLCNGLIIMGNEGNGISEAIKPHITAPLFIPSYANGMVTESLNVAIATAITCAEFRRRGI